MEGEEGFCRDRGESADCCNEVTASDWFSTSPARKSGEEGMSNSKLSITPYWWWGFAKTSSD